MSSMIASSSSVRLIALFICHFPCLPFFSAGNSFQPPGWRTPFFSQSTHKSVLRFVQYWRPHPVQVTLRKPSFQDLYGFFSACSTSRNACRSGDIASSNSRVINCPHRLQRCALFVEHSPCFFPAGKESRVGLAQGDGIVSFDGGFVWDPVKLASHSNQLGISCIFRSSPHRKQLLENFIQATHPNRSTLRPKLNIGNTTNQGKTASPRTRRHLIHKLSFSRHTPQTQLFNLHREPSRSLLHQVFCWRAGICRSRHQFG